VRTEGPVPVTMAATSVAQVINNLLDNAALHGRPPVTVTVDRVAGAGRLMVADQGDGMDPDMLAIATHRFSRSAASRSRPGFGLGLSLVEGMVKRAGGQLRLCCAGTHERFGHPFPAPCQHGDEMTASVLLPAHPGSAVQPALASQVEA
jgi:two-component system, OmpR family, sensor kinase